MDKHAKDRLRELTARMAIDIRTEAQKEESTRLTRELLAESDGMRGQRAVGGSTKRITVKRLEIMIPILLNGLEPEDRRSPGSFKTAVKISDALPEYGMKAGPRSVQSYISAHLTRSKKI